MAEGLNRVVLIGNLGRDPELRYTANGTGVLGFSLATTESYFDKNSNERKERTDWHNVVIWGKRGESLDKLLRKGSRCCIEGRLQTRSWDDKQGAKRYTTEVIATNVVLLDAARAARGGSSGANERDGANEHDTSFNDDDIPF